MNQDTPNTNPAASALQAFAFDSQAVRVVTRDGEPWFVAKDVCACLNIHNHRNAIANLDADEKGLHLMETLGGQQTAAVMSESGMYATVLRCRDAMTAGTPAHTFRKWVTSEVLPSLRKTGAYATAQVQPMHALEARLDRMVTVLEKLIDMLPQIVQAVVAKPAKAPRRRVHINDANLILSLHKEGQKVKEISQRVGVSMRNVFCIVDGRYRELPDGYVSIWWQSNELRAAQAAERAQAATDARQGDFLDAV
jgi:prophage antirepressor-like protein